MSDTDAINIESTELSARPSVGLGLVIISLILPVAAVVPLLFVTSFHVALGIGAATVIVSSALVAIDASRLGKVDLKGRQRETAGVLFVGMCLLWIFVYPMAFFRRRDFASPNLGFVALFVAVFFVGGPFVGSLVIPVRLPSCSSKEVVQLLEQIIRSTPVGATAKSIDGHQELSYDSIANVRHGECVAHTDSGDIPVKFIVEWQDRKKNLFQVRLSEPQLPSCSSQDVVLLLEQIIRSNVVGATVKSIDGHQELNYDSSSSVRHGECVAHTDSGDIPVKFIVEWQDRKKNLFQVRLSEPQLPSCSSKDVVLLLEQIIRSTAVGATAKSIDAHRELSYDSSANVRHGECVAHTDSGDIPVKFIVEWRDREKNVFHVQILVSPTETI